MYDCQKSFPKRKDQIMRSKPYIMYSVICDCTPMMIVELPQLSCFVSSTTTWELILWSCCRQRPIYASYPRLHVSKQSKLLLCRRHLAMYTVMVIR